MLSKKMTVSLTSLITILALAFIAPTAMAGEFGVSLDKTGDVSTATDDLELVHPGDGKDIKVTLKFDQAVVLAASKVFVTTYDKDGKIVSIPAATVAETTASKTATLTIPVKEAAVKVNIKIAKGIASADPINADTSKALDVNIGLVADDDDAGPTVYSMRRADNPLLPVTSATVQVIVTLSEMPKEFKKGNLSISDNATIADPVALDPIAEDPNRFRSIRIQDLQAIAGATPPVARGSYNRDNNNDGDTTDDEDAGIHKALQANEDLIAAVQKYNRAVTVWNARNGQNVTDAAAIALGTDPVAITNAGLPIDAPSAAIATYNALLHDPFTTYRINAAGDGLERPTFPNDQTTYAKGNEKIKEADTYELKRSATPTKPAIDGADGALYKLILADHAFYNAQVAVRKAYKDAVMAEQEKDKDALAEYYAKEHGTLVESATGRDSMLHPYVVTITPKYPAGKADIVLKIGAWEDTNHPVSNKYTPPLTDDGYTEGVDKITIKVGKETLTALEAGTQIYLPHGEGAKIPASGFYILTKNKDGSGIDYSHEKDEENLAHKQTPEQLKFNVRAGGIPNLENLFLQGGTIDLVAYDGTAATAAYISEVMWGSDASQADSFNSQWIEIANTTASAISIGEKKWALWVYQAHETPATSYTGGTLIDRIGTERSDTGVFWSVIGTAGQSGRTNIDPGGADVVAIAPTLPLISMVRLVDASDAPQDGTLPMSWAPSAGPSVNFKLGIEGTRLATPGAADIARPVAPTPVAPKPTIPVATGTDIEITEIMVDTDDGRLPQWIELTHVGMGKVSLEGWEMVIDNAIDADVLGKGNAITVNLSGTLDVSAHTGNTGKGQSLLVVAWPARRSSTNISTARVIDLSTQLNQKSRYQLLSYKGFRITLAPPRTGATVGTFGDIVGNLHEDWEIPMAEGTARSSLIRREEDAKGMDTMGTDANGWVLASSSSLITGQTSFYGNDEDAGTPGHDSGGPLPVELSMFYPARDKLTGAVVIKWETQSELNNAGFFIKRSQQRTTNFKVINATMIPGAGTTSEKQTYTYTDTTAQPNVVYYYQIEDVSLDGQRQQLTRGIRLRGHIGAAGKATTTWGELKTSNE